MVEKTNLNVLFGLALVCVHPKTAKNSLIHNWCIGGCWVTQQAEKLKRRPFHFPLPILYLWMRFPIQSFFFYVELLNSRKSSLVNLSL
jgi:hypothetical protein